MRSRFVSLVMTVAMLASSGVRAESRSERLAQIDAAMAEITRIKEDMRDSEKVIHDGEVRVLVRLGLGAVTAIFGAAAAAELTQGPPPGQQGRVALRVTRRGLVPQRMDPHPFLRFRLAGQRALIFAGFVAAAAYFAHSAGQEITAVLMELDDWEQLQGDLERNQRRLAELRQGYDELDR